MAILAFDTSSKVCTVALGTADKVLVEYSLNMDYTHSEYLMTLIEEALKTAQLRGADLEAIAVASGPGSFTGLRIGMAVAKGLAVSWSCPVYAFTSLQVLAAGEWGGQVPVMALISAQRGEVYGGLFSTSDGCPQLEGDYFMGRLESEASGRIDADIPVRFVGNGALQFAEEIKELYTALENSPRHHIPQAGSLIALTADALRRGVEAEDFHTLEPFYMRISAAEQNRLARLAKEEKNES